MRDVISNETIKEINAVIDEILTNIDDNVRNIVGAGNYSLPIIFSYTNYSGQTINVHGSTFRHEIIIDNADGNNLIGDICTVIGDRNGIKLAKAGVEDRHDTFANYWDSTFDIAYDSDTAVNGYVFNMQSGFVGEGTGQSKVMSFKLDNLEVGKAYTLTFRGKFVSAQFVSGQESLVRVCSTTAETPYLAQVTLEKDTDAHIYRIDFTNNTQDTTLYLNFWFYGVADDTETYHSEFIADDLIIAGMNIGIISRYIDYNGKWYPIEAGSGTSDLDAIELTYAEYQALTPAEKTDPDKIYFITDYPSGSGVVINPTGTATDTAETIEVDGTIYDFAGTDADAVHTADIGVAGGVAELDSNGKVPSSQLPSYVDDVVEYASISAFPATGESGKIYIALDTNKTYRWTGSVYVEISPSLALGETSSTAYRGDRGKTAYDHSQSDHRGIAPAFTEASTRANIASGETFATLLGKIKKFFSDLKAVAFSGSYSDLSGTPTIPTVNNGALTIQKNGSNVATFTANQSGNSTANITVPTGDLASINKDGTSSTKYLRGDGTWQTFPTIPTVNNATLTIQKNGTTVETFTANASSNKTANITVPTKTSELTNDSGYTTNTGTVTQVKVGSTPYSPSSGVVSLPAYPTSLPASDVSAWAKASTKPSYNFGEIGAGIASIGDGTNGIKWRTNASWTSGVYYQTTGDESVVFCNKNERTSWMFAYADLDTRPAWNAITPSLQIKKGKVAINKLIANSAYLTYELEVNGDVQATNFRGALVGNATSATKATQDGDGNTISSTYLKKSGGTMTGTLTSRSIEPVSDILYSLGLSSKRFNVGWFRILDSDTITCGRTGVGGKSVQGILEFYPYNHTNDNRVQFMVDSDATLTTIYTVNIRAKSGTLALTSDIPSVPSQAETTRRSRYTMSTKGAWTTASYSSNLPSSYGHAIILIYYTISGIRCLMNEIRVTKAEWEDCASPNIMMPFVSSPPNDAYGVYLQYVSTSQFKYYVGSGLQGDWSVTIKTTVV